MEVIFFVLETCALITSHTEFSKPTSTVVNEEIYFLKILLFLSHHIDQINVDGTILQIDANNDVLNKIGQAENISHKLLDNEACN